VKIAYKILGLCYNAGGGNKKRSAISADLTYFYAMSLNLF